MTTIATENEPFLTNPFGDRYLYSVNRNAFQSLGTDTLYRNHYGDKLFGEHSLHIVLGTDSGLLLRHVLKHGVPTGTRYLFLELEDVGAALEREGLYRDLPETIRVCAPKEWLGAAHQQKIEQYLFTNAVAFHESIGAADGHRSEYLELAWNIQLKLQTLHYDVRVSLGDSVFYYRQLENLAESRQSFSEHLVGAFGGKTAVILAGGPSLGKALPWVKANRDKVVVIAVSRICRQLIDQGVVPHIVISVDPHKVSFDVSKEMLSFADRSLFIHLFHVTPHLLGQWSGRHLFAGHRLPWQSPLNKDELHYTGPTVGNTSLSIAIHMGFSRIILAGVDLCHSKEGTSHAEGSNESAVGPNLGHVSEKVETYGGWHAETIQAFVIGIPMLRLAAEEARGKGISVYNCALGAAKVPGIEYRPLEEFEFPEEEAPVARALELLIPRESSRSRLAYYRRALKEIESAQKKCQEILGLVNEALGCCNRLFAPDRKPSDFKHKVRMDKIERKLDRQYRKYTHLVKLFGIMAFIDILKTPEREEDWTDEQIEHATRSYYESYHASTVYLIGLFNLVQQRIEARIEEEAEKPDFARLFAQWERDQQPGRLRVFQKRRPEWERLMTAAEKEEALRLEERFQAILAEKETTQLASVQKSHDVSGVLKKALLLFRRREKSELELLARGLEAHRDREKALPYLHLVQGFLAELGEEPERAIDCYHELLVDPPHAATEDALKQIAILSIAGADIDNALAALDCLAAISPAYLPPYGDLLKAVQRYEEAFDVYNRYLALAPDDISTLMKLGQFCLEAGLADLARDLFRRVLEKDEANGAAKGYLEQLEAPAPARATP